MQRGQTDNDLGLLSVADERLFWMDASANIYERVGQSWKSHGYFTPKTEEQIPDDAVPRAVIGI